MTSSSASRQRSSSLRSDAWIVRLAQRRRPGVDPQRPALGGTGRAVRREDAAQPLDRRRPPWPGRGRAGRRRARRRTRRPRRAARPWCRSGRRPVRCSRRGLRRRRRRAAPTSRCFSISAIVAARISSRRPRPCDDPCRDPIDAKLEIHRMTTTSDRQRRHDRPARSRRDSAAVRSSPGCCPRAAYTSDEVFAWEQRHLFAGT